MFDRYITLRGGIASIRARIPRFLPDALSEACLRRCRPPARDAGRFSGDGRPVGAESAYHRQIAGAGRTGLAPPMPSGALVMSGGALHVADQPHQQGVQVGGGREDPVDRLGSVQPLLAAEGTSGDQ